MNLTSGLETELNLFWPTVAGSCAVGGGMYVLCRSFLSGKGMQKRAVERAREVQAVTGVLSDMNSLDYAVKMLVEAKAAEGTEAVEREEFRAGFWRGGGRGRESDGR